MDIKFNRRVVGSLGIVKMHEEENVGPDVVLHGNMMLKALFSQPNQLEITLLVTLTFHLSFHYQYLAVMFEVIAGSAANEASISHIAFCCPLYIYKHDYVLRD